MLESDKEVDRIVEEMEEGLSPDDCAPLDKIKERHAEIIRNQMEAAGNSVENKKSSASNSGRTKKEEMENRMMRSMDA